MHTIIPSESIEAAFSSLKTSPELFSVEQYSQSAASAVDISESSIVRLKGKISKIYDSIDISYFKSSEWNKVDGITAALLHQDLQGISAKVALSANFWIFLSLYMRDIIYKRHGYASWEELKPIHFGVSVFDSLLPRLWHRAFLSIDVSNVDPYWLTRRGGSDYWSSFVLRATYAQAPQLIRALTRFFYDPESAAFRMGEVNGKSDIIRVIGPEIRKQHSITPYETLSENECFEVICALADDLGIIREYGKEDLE